MLRVSYPLAQLKGPRMNITRDDIRAAVGAGKISEAQAASILALADSRRGARENIEGLDEPFELFRGFNEIFIIVGLSILYLGWMTITGIGVFSAGEDIGISALVFAIISLAVTIFLARYFTLQRRMVGPSIALSLMFAASAGQFGFSLAYLFGWITVFNGPLPQAFSLAFGTSTAFLVGYWIMFRVPFVVAMIAVGVFATLASFFVIGGAEFENPSDIFLLTNKGPFAYLTIVLGIIGFFIAMRFDMSDPHRVTRRAANGFWLHIISAPAIVNTVALTLFDADSIGNQILLLVFLTFIAAVAVIIDRRSFLVAGIGYVVALAFIVLEGQAGLAILALGIGLVTLGATWEKIRKSLMMAIPNFPGKERMPPWAGASDEPTE